MFPLEQEILERNSPDRELPAGPPQSVLPRQEIAEPQMSMPSCSEDLAQLSLRLEGPSSVVYLLNPSLFTFHTSTPVRSSLTHHGEFRSGVLCFLQHRGCLSVAFASHCLV